MQQPFYDRRHGNRHFGTIDIMGIDLLGIDIMGGDILGTGIQALSRHFQCYWLTHNKEKCPIEGMYLNSTSYLFILKEDLFPN